MYFLLKMGIFQMSCWFSGVQIEEREAKWFRVHLQLKHLLCFLLLVSKNVHICKYNIYTYVQIKNLDLQITCSWPLTIDVAILPYSQTFPPGQRYPEDEHAAGPPPNLASQIFLGNSQWNPMESHLMYHSCAHGSNWHLSGVMICFGQLHIHMIYIYL